MSVSEVVLQYGSDGPVACLMVRSPSVLARLFCNRCGREWIRRSEKLPRQCPACKSLRWNRPVLFGGKDDAEGGGAVLPSDLPSAPLPPSMTEGK